MTVNQFCKLLVCLFLFALPAVAAAHELKPVVWFDQGHGQHFKVDRQDSLDLSRFADLFEKRGWAVATGEQQLTPELLQGVDALVLSGAFSPYSAAEIKTIIDFVRSGKHLSVMLHIGPTFGSLLHDLVVDFSNGVIREAGDAVLEGEPLNFSVSRLAEHPLTQGVEKIYLYGVWALHNDAPNVQVLASTSPESWVDLNGNRVFDKGDARQSFGVVVVGTLGAGSFVVFGDDAVFQNQFFAQNRKLAENLSDWLGGSKTGHFR